MSVKQQSPLNSLEIMEKNMVNYARMRNSFSEMETQSKPKSKVLQCIKMCLYVSIHWWCLC